MQKFFSITLCEFIFFRICCDRIYSTNYRNKHRYDNTCNSNDFFCIKRKIYSYIIYVNYPPTKTY